MRRRAILVVLLVAAPALGAALAPAGAAPPSRAVKGTVRQAYIATPRRNAAAETPRNRAAAYRGPRLDLQAAYIGRNAVEPTLGVDRDGQAFYAAGAFDGVGGTARTEILKSSDGREWHSVQPKIAGRHTPPLTLDPYVWVDPDTGRVFSVDLYVGCSHLSFTDDGGETWEHNPLACGVPVNDHQTLTSGPPPDGMPAPIGYRNYVYYCVNQIADVACGRSIDGGTTFGPAGSPAFTGIDAVPGGVVCGGLHGHAVVDPDGRLLLPKGHCTYPWLAVSEDGGVTWRRVQVSDIRSAGIQTAVAVDDAGNYFYVWWDRADRLPYLSVSRNAGRTWSTPVMVAPPGVHEVNFPTIDAAGRGRVAITFPGTTVDAPDDKTRPWNYYVVTTTDALASRPLFVSATANPPADPIHRGDCISRCGGMFDFLDVVIAPAGDIWATATDTCVDRCVTTESASARALSGMAVRQIGGPGLRRR